MVWTKKAAAPDYTEINQFIAQGIIGGPDAWIIPWLPMGNFVGAIDINALCALGPPEEVELTALDFVGFIGGNRFGNAIQSLSLGEKISKWLMGRVFASYCEQFSTGGETCTLIGRFSPGDGPGTSFCPAGGWLIPAGVHKIKGTMITAPAGSAGWHWYGLQAGSNIANPSPDNIASIVPGASVSATWSAGIDHVVAYSGDPGCVVDFYWCIPGSFSDYTPPAQVQPDSAIPPTMGPYTTIPELGAALDSIEAKLHWVLNYVEPPALERFIPLVADELLTPTTEDEDLALADDVMGVIVHVANVGPQTDMKFGDPIGLHHVGRVVMGTGEAWLPAIDIDVTPMLLLRPDPTVKFVRVQVYAPATATVTTLVRPAPVG